MLPEGVGYIQIPYFTSGTLTKVKSALAEFGKKKTRDVILDLRRCCGGAFDESVKVAELILGGGVVGQIEQKLQKPAQIPKGAKAGGSPKFSYTVLIDKGTAGVAELIVGGLRERSGAKVVGESSFGDDVVVDVVDAEVMKFQSGRRLQLPVGRLLTAKGTRFGHKGFSPDVKVAFAGPLGSENDVVLAKARDLAKQAKVSRASKGGTD
jgi:carboxyl-terminal processing protease